MTYVQIGLVSSSYEIGYGLTLFLGGYLATRFALKTLICGALLWFAFMLSVTALSDSFIQLASARIATAIAMGIYFACGISLISHYFAEHERGLALGIHWGVGGGAGQLLTPILVGMGLVVLGWRILFLLLAIPACLASFLFWKIVNPASGPTQAQPITSGLLWGKIVSNPTLISLGLVNASLVAGMVVLFSFLPTYAVVNLGMSPLFAGLLLALFNGIGIPSALLFGLLSDRWGRRPIILMLGAASSIVFVLITVFISSTTILPLMVMAGLVVGTGFPITVTYVVDMTPAECRGLAVGYVNTVTVLSTSLILVLGGYLSDAFGVISVFAFAAAISVAGCIAIIRHTHHVPTLRTG